MCHNGFVKEERNPFFGVSVISGRAAAEFVAAVDVPDELSVAECGDDVDVAGVVNAVEVHVPGWFFDGR